MEKITHLVWELQQNGDSEYQNNIRIIEEFYRIEDELLYKLMENEEVLPNEIKYRNQLNKLAANIPMYQIEVYDIRDKLKERSEVV